MTVVFITIPATGSGRRRLVTHSSLVKTQNAYTRTESTSQPPLRQLPPASRIIPPTRRFQLARRDTSPSTGSSCFPEDALCCAMSFLGQSCPSSDDASAGTDCDAVLAEFPSLSGFSLGDLTSALNNGGCAESTSSTPSATPKPSVELTLSSTPSSSPTTSSRQTSTNRTTSSSLISTPTMSSGLTSNSSPTPTSNPTPTPSSMSPRTTPTLITTTTSQPTTSASPTPTASTSSLTFTPTESSSAPSTTPSTIMAVDTSPISGTPLTSSLPMSSPTDGSPTSGVQPTNLLLSSSGLSQTTSDGRQTSTRTTLYPTPSSLPWSTIPTISAAPTPSDPSAPSSSTSSPTPSPTSSPRSTSLIDTTAAKASIGGGIGGIALLALLLVLFLRCRRKQPSVITPYDYSTVPASPGFLSTEFNVQVKLGLHQRQRQHQHHQQQDQHLHNDDHRQSTIRPVSHIYPTHQSDCEIAVVEEQDNTTLYVPEDRSAVALRERERELEKLYPSRRRRREGGSGEHETVVGRVVSEETLPFAREEGVDG